MLKKIILVVLLIPIVLVGISVLLPAHYQVRRTLVMPAKPEAVFAMVNTLKQWPEWTAWNVVRYPDMQISYAGPESGVGAAYSWSGKSSGNGTLKLTSSDPAKGVTYDLDFEHGKYVSKGQILLRPVADAVEVTWINEGNLGWNPVDRYFGLLMDRMMGPDMETGLRNLQRRVEPPPPPPPTQAPLPTNAPPPPK
jgi:hypothetical protein